MLPGKALEMRQPLDHDIEAPPCENDPTMEGHARIGRLASPAETRTLWTLPPVPMIGTASPPVPVPQFIGHSTLPMGKRGDDLFTGTGSGLVPKEETRKGLRVSNDRLNTTLHVNNFHGIKRMQSTMNTTEKGRTLLGIALL